MRYSGNSSSWWANGCRKESW